jgi:hypothetical protein
MLEGEGIGKKFIGVLAIAEWPKIGNFFPKCLKKRKIVGDEW